MDPVRDRARTSEFSNESEHSATAVSNGAEEHDDAYWKQKLTSEQYKILREKGTEPAFTGEYWDAKAEGMYKCTACGAELFDSGTKFYSGTGWPSFTEAKSGAVVFEHDSSLGMNRTEVMCAKCGGHLGHIFDDGPRDKGGKRFCINSCALDLEEKP